jgi:hypothetical protein
LLERVGMSAMCQKQTSARLTRSPRRRGANVSRVPCRNSIGICASAQAARRFVLSHCTVSLLNEPALGRIMIETRDRGSARHDWKGGYHDRQEHFGQQARRSRHD